MTADAALHDLVMIDAQRGWAVGDRGVVLFTEDGGRRWIQQDTRVTERLTGVSFVDERNGWAGGRRSDALHALDTRGGAPHHRRRLHVAQAARAADAAPARRAVLQHAEWTGVGRGLPLSPSGLFHTRDGGAHWETIHADRACSWRKASFVNEKSGLLLDAKGVLAAYQGARSRARPAHGIVTTQRDRAVWRRPGLGRGPARDAASDNQRGSGLDACHRGAGVARTRDCGAGSTIAAVGSPGNRALISRDRGTQLVAGCHRRVGAHARGAVCRRAARLGRGRSRHDHRNDRWRTILAGPAARGAKLPGAGACGDPVLTCRWNWSPSSARPRAPDQRRRALSRTHAMSPVRTNASATRWLAQAPRLPRPPPRSRCSPPNKTPPQANLLAF